MARHYRDAACNEWDAGEVPGLKLEGFNGVTGQTVDTVLYVSIVFYPPVKFTSILEIIIASYTMCIFGLLFD